MNVNEIYLVKECYHRSFLFQLWKFVHYYLIYNSMPLRMKELKVLIRPCGRLRITKHHEITKKSCSVDSQGVITKRQIWNGFSNFRSGEYVIKRWT